MIPIRSLFAAGLTVALGTASLDAQATRRSSAVDRARALREASSALEEAKDRQFREQVMEKARAASESKQGQQLQAAAAEALESREAGESVEELKQRAVQEANLRETLAGASPEAAEIIRASRQTPSAVATAAVQLVAQATGETGVGGEPGVPDPPERVTVPPRKIKELEPNEMEKSRVIITARDTAFFDANARIAIFNGDVFVDHPGFDLWCDTLEIFFKKAATAGAAEDATSEGSAPDPAGPDGDSEIEKIIATGREVRIEKLSADGTLQIGKSQKAVYDTETGNVTLLISPQVQKDKNLIIAEEESAVMTFYPNGAMKTSGKIKTLLANTSGKSKREEEEAAEQAPPPPPPATP